jgi:hypothetical protein
MHQHGSLTLCTAALHCNLRSNLQYMNNAHTGAAECLADYSPFLLFAAAEALQTDPCRRMCGIRGSDCTPGLGGSELSLEPAVGGAPLGIPDD